DGEKQVTTSTDGTHINLKDDQFRRGWGCDPDGSPPHTRDQENLSGRDAGGVPFFGAEPSEGSASPGKASGRSP
ncbi:unnamed protein product, partial [Amoebophrya sp. A25]